MGLFDKFKKKISDDEILTQTTSEEVSEETKEIEDTEETSQKSEEITEELKENSKVFSGEVKPTSQTPRFSLVAENIFEVDKDESIAIAGNIHGKISIGDEFFIIHPKFREPLTAKVYMLVVNKETCDSASECRVAIKILTKMPPEEIPKYAVISNIAPQIVNDPSKPVENPFLLGLTTEYNRLVNESEFTFAFMVALLTSRYITPTDMELSAPLDDGRVAIKDSKVNFKLLRHPNNENLLVLPLFTDKSALSLWKDALTQKDSNGKAKVLIMPFERFAQVGLKSGGIVINPFGPAPVYVSKGNIANTLELGKKTLARQQEAERRSDSTK